MSADAETRELKAHVWAREEHEHYVEEPIVSSRLFDVEAFEGAIFDPACGFGHIVQSARARGLTADGADIVNRGASGLKYIGNFLERTAPVANIVCNPPFDIIQEFTEHAVKLADRKVAMICPTRRLNAAGAWLQALPLVQIWYLTPRPSMPPGHVYRGLASQGKRPSGGTQDFCWLVFQRGYAGRIEAGWLHRDGAGE